jgi:hypothetical protein
VCTSNVSASGSIQDGVSATFCRRTSELELGSGKYIAGHNFLWSLREGDIGGLVYLVCIKARHFLNETRELIYNLWSTREPTVRSDARFGPSGPAELYFWLYLEYTFKHINMVILTCGEIFCIGAVYGCKFTNSDVTVIIWHIGSVHGQPLPVTELVVEMVQYASI